MERLKSSGKQSAANINENTSLMNSSSVYVSNLPQNEGGMAMMIIDPQYDFIEGSLAVSGAKEDCKRIAQFIMDNIHEIQDIYVTLDSHMNYHIAHPSFWRNKKGEQPAPFTQISHEQVLKEEWSPVHNQMKEWVKYYTKQLEKPRIKGLNGFTLTIWPEHCRIGSIGHTVNKDIQEALYKWEKIHSSMVHYIMKGNNSKTEHYSAFRAEVVIKEDPATQFNIQLYNNLIGHSRIYIAGQAKSHCVNYTVRDLVQRMGKKEAMKKVVLLGNCMSSVDGCEEMGRVFMHDMTNLNKNEGLEVINVEKGLNVTLRLANSKI